MPAMLLFATSAGATTVLCTNLGPMSMTTRVETEHSPELTALVFPALHWDKLPFSLGR